MLTALHIPIRYPRMRYSKPYHDAVGLQRLLTKASEDAPTKELSNIAKAFVALEMLKMRIRMKPAPKPVDVSKMMAGKSPMANASTFSE